MKVFSLLLCSAFACIAVGQGNQVKGQQQLKGVGGEFGVTYTLKNGFNFSILSAKYSIEPYNSGTPVLASGEEKILLLQVAIKNSNATDNFLDASGLFSFSDTANQVYSGSGTPTLKSLGSREVGLSLRPGQGLGQPSLNDPLTFAFTIPASAKIDKIMVNVGRAGKSEDVIRYELKEPPKTGDTATKNFIQPLPEAFRIKEDPLGAVLSETGVGIFGSELASGYFHLKVDAPTTPGDAVFSGNSADEGKKYVVVNVAAKSMVDADISVYEAAGDSRGNELTDEDGERYQPIGYRKRKADEDPEHSFKFGEEYGYRVFFMVPKDAKPKKLTIGARRGLRWAFDLEKP